MRKYIYLAIVIITIYLNLVYIWPEGEMILAAEILFFVFCILTAILAGWKITGSLELDEIILEQKETAKVRIFLKNALPLSVPVKLSVGYQYLTGGERIKQTYKVCLGGKQKKEINWEINPEHCGKIECSIQKLRVYDLLGISSVTKKSKEKQFVTVMPKPYPAALVVSGRTRWFPIEGESYAQDRSGEDSAEIYDIREYQAGDRLQKVHWKLSAKEEELYIKEFSYPIGAAVILMLEEDAKGTPVGNLLMEAVISISAALLEQACAHYIAWKEKEQNEITRVLIRTEEELYTVMLSVLEFSKHCLEPDVEAKYRYTYKNDIYSTILRIDTGMKLHINGEEMNLVQSGLETFFHTVEIVV